MLGAALASAANKQRSARAERLCGIKAFIDVAAVTLYRTTTALTSRLTWRVAQDD